METVKLGCWNINGLCRKLSPGSIFSLEVCKIIDSFDFVGLVETWTTVRSNVQVSGYRHVCKHRPKRKRKGRLSGGLILYYKAHYDRYVTVLSCQHEDVMWVKISKQGLGSEQDIYIYTFA